MAAASVYNMLIPPELFFISNLDPKQQIDIQNFVESGDFVLVPDLKSRFLKLFFLTMLVLFLFSEALSVCVIYSIVSTLRRNMKTYSKNTYRLHLNLSILLGVQVTFIAI
jgi:hypothetical protein